MDEHLTFLSERARTAMEALRLALGIKTKWSHINPARGFDGTDTLTGDSTQTNKSLLEASGLPTEKNGCFQQPSIISCFSFKISDARFCYRHGVVNIDED